MAVVNKKRIMITVSEEMARKIEYYSDRMGIPQSALCASFVGQGIMGYEKAYEVIENVGRQMAVDGQLNNELSGQVELKEAMEAMTK